MSTTRRILITVAEAAVLFTLACWAGLLLTLFFKLDIDGAHDVGKISTLAAVVIVPDSLASWWLFQRLRKDHPQSAARRAAIAFAVSAPLVLAVGNVLGVGIGGYAEVFLGRLFILPAAAAFVIVLEIFLPSAVVAWALHPSGGIGPVSGNDQDEHR